VEEYLQHGPSFVFLYHPALGPLWEVVGQKLRGGRLAHGAEVVLEVAEAQVGHPKMPLCGYNSGMVPEVHWVR